MLVVVGIVAAIAAAGVSPAHAARESHRGHDRAAASCRAPKSPTTCGTTPIPPASRRRRQPASGSATASSQTSTRLRSRSRPTASRTSQQPLPRQAAAGSGSRNASRFPSTRAGAARSADRPARSDAGGNNAVSNNGVLPHAIVARMNNRAAGRLVAAVVRESGPGRTGRTQDSPRGISNGS